MTVEEAVNAFRQEVRAFKSAKNLSENALAELLHSDRGAVRRFLRGADVHLLTLRKWQEIMTPRAERKQRTP